MVEARKRNPAIQLYALAWGWPGYLRKGTKSNNPFTDFALVADYLTSWLDIAQKNYNLTIDFIGIWNEMYSGPYDFIPYFRKALDSAGFVSTKVIVADAYGNRWGIAGSLAINATRKAAVWGIGAHYPGAQSSPEARALDLPLWASEDNSLGGLSGGECLARAINENYVNGDMTATISWHLVSAYYTGVPWFGASLLSAGWPTSGTYTVNHAMWAVAHTAQFIQPGWRYLSHGAGVGYLTGGGTYISATNGTGGLTIVLEKLSRKSSQCAYAPSPPNATVSELVVLDGLSAILLLHVWTSNFTQSASPHDLFQYAGTLVPSSNGTVTVSLGVGVVITLTTLNTGMHGNRSAPPAHKPFPLPYSDNFDHYALQSEAAYFSDMSGAFEIVNASAYGHSNVLQQMTPVKPIDWLRPNYAPHTIIGDSWYDTEANVSILLTNASHTAALGVRMQQIDSMVGVLFAVNSTVWSIWTSLKALASGGTANYSGSITSHLEPGTWHQLSLTAIGPDKAIACIDGIAAANVNISSFQKGGGWVALATAGFGQDVMFDDFSVSLPRQSVVLPRQS